eukprot:2191105-Pleurochrysis_carterae.AAC.1
MPAAQPLSPFHIKAMLISAPGLACSPAQPSTPRDCPPPPTFRDLRIFDPNAPTARSLRLGAVCAGCPPLVGHEAGGARPHRSRHGAPPPPSPAQMRRAEACRRGLAQWP